jgi:rhodanese-related sulfurtransferase
MKHLTPTESWDFLQAHPQAVFVDVRMEIEYMYVGHPPRTVNIPWYEYPDMTPDPADFARQVEREAGGDKSRPVVLICRSAKRTIPAGETLEGLGFTNVINVLEGFEGDLNDNMHRGTKGGWRHAGLPWEQM